MLAFLVGLTSLAAFNAMVVPTYLEAQATRHPDAPAVMLLGKHADWLHPAAPGGHPLDGGSPPPAAAAAAAASQQAPWTGITVRAENATMQEMALLPAAMHRVGSYLAKAERRRWPGPLGELARAVRGLKGLGLGAGVRMGLGLVVGREGAWVAKALADSLGPEALEGLAARMERWGAARERGACSLEAYRANVVKHQEELRRMQVGWQRGGGGGRGNGKEWPVQWSLPSCVLHARQPQRRTTGRPLVVPGRRSPYPSLRLLELGSA